MKKVVTRVMRMQVLKNLWGMRRHAFTISGGFTLIALFISSTTDIYKPNLVIN